MAVYVLATHKGNIKDRLFFAFQEFSAVTEDEIPENIQSDFNWIRQELTKKEAKAPIGRLGQTLLKMRIKKAQKIAERIYYVKSLLDEISRLEDT